MKKLIVGLLAAFLMATGLVAVTSSSPAQADCARPSYPDACFATRTGVTVTPKGAGPFRRTFTASVTGVGTSARPVGVFKFRFKRVGGGAEFVQRTVPRSGRLSLTRLIKPRGKWEVRVTFQGRDNGIFKNSTSKIVRFRVR